MRKIKVYLGLLILAVMFTSMPFQAYGQKSERAVTKQAKYRVVINHEEQYSIWVSNREVPKGWKPTGFIGSKEEALDNIEEVWTDMRPLSARRKTALEIYQRQAKQK